MRKEIKAAVSSGLRELTEMQLNTGEFIYRTGPNVPTPDKRYNILRHSGAVYALSECSAFSQTPVNNSVANGITWVAQDHLRIFMDGTDWLLPVASDDRTNGSFNALKLGGSALYIAAVCSASENKIYEFPADLLEKIGAFLLFMQQEDGRFHSKMYRRSKRINQEFISLYYPGEAALALTYLGHRDPNGPWFASASNALTYLARLRKGRQSVEPDHWALIATAYLLNSGYELPEESRDEICAHAEQVASSMILEFDDVGRDGCCTGDGRTCPTATRLEGLAAIHPLLANEHNSELAQRALDIIEQYTRFLLDAQYPDGYRKGGFPRSSEKWLRENNSAPDKRSDEVRIDYIQHAICGLKDASKVLYG